MCTIAVVWIEMIHVLLLVYCIQIICDISVVLMCNNYNFFYLDKQWRRQDLEDGGAKFIPRSPLTFPSPPLSPSVPPLPSSPLKADGTGVLTHNLLLL